MKRLWHRMRETMIFNSSCRPEIAEHLAFPRVLRVVGFAAPYLR